MAPIRLASISLQSRLWLRRSAKASPEAGCSASAEHRCHVHTKTHAKKDEGFSLEPSAGRA